MTRVLANGGHGRGCVGWRSAPEMCAATDGWMDHYCHKKLWNPRPWSACPFLSSHPFVSISASHLHLAHGSCQMIREDKELCHASTWRGIAVAEHG